jgi:hypothetical protein
VVGHALGLAGLEGAAGVGAGLHEILGHVITGIAMTKDYTKKHKKCQETQTKKGQY